MDISTGASYYQIFPQLVRGTAIRSPIIVHASLFLLRFLSCFSTISLLFSTFSEFTMGAIDIPELQYTPLDDIQGRVAELRQTFSEHKTRDVEFRLVQLRKLYWA